MDGRQWVWRKRLWAVVFCALVFFALLFTLVPVLVRAREQGRRSTCGNNIGNILMCCRLYANSHAGKWPERLSQLYPKYVKDLDVFNCPCTTGPKVLTAEDIDTKCSYRYFPERILTEGDLAAVIEEKGENHPGSGGRNIGIAAGSVEWWDEGSSRATRDEP